MEYNVKPQIMNLAGYLLSFYKSKFTNAGFRGDTGFWGRLPVVHNKYTLKYSLSNIIFYNLN